MDIFVLDLIGTAIFAYAGAVVAHGRGFNLLGIYFFGMLTAIGGGTLRQLLLEPPGLFWIDSVEYSLIGAAAIGLGYVSSFRVKTDCYPFRMLNLLALAIFITIGIGECVERGSEPHVAITMGVLTGVGGSIMRDLLTGRQPQVFTDQTISLALVAACCGVYVAGTTEHPPLLGVCTSMALAELIRLYMKRNSVAIAI